MKVKLTCAWCSEPYERRKNDTGKLYCEICGHRADAPKVECDCRKCRVVPKPTRPLEKVA